MRIVVAITGASGSLYGVRLVVRAVELGGLVDLIASPSAEQVARTELGYELDPKRGPFHAMLGARADQVRRFDHGEVGAEPASGSAPVNGMAIVPCSMGTLARIAAGLSGNLVERAADVTLKERRPLVLVPRETPLNRIHLQNMIRLLDAGAVLLPAMPSFYHQPETVQDLVDGVVDRALSFFFGSEAVRSKWNPEGVG
ncbi:MAG: UbiX family flavin prenyltransferase [Planctomycetota bacterium]